MNIGVDMSSGESFTRIVLYCACETLAEFDSSEAAYDAGWRLRRQRNADQPYKAVCPACMAKRDRKWRQCAVAQYGAEAVERSEMIMREKHR